MEEWLMSQGFKEVVGIWYSFLTKGTLAVYIEEDGNWSACFGKEKVLELNCDNQVFSCLPKDQAQESIQGLMFGF